MVRSYFHIVFFIFWILSLFKAIAINLNDIYDELPNISFCNEGKLKNSEKQRIVAILNQIREIHNLKPLEYNASFDNEEAKSALITVANMILDHFPKSSYFCYTQQGYNGSSTSNLNIYVAMNSSMAPDSKIALSAWLIDKNVSDLGHRRNMLNPFLKYTSFGRVDGNPITNPQYFVTGMSLKVHNLPESQNLSDWNYDFVAYPFQDYPSDFFDGSWYLSFSVVADKSNIWNNGNDQVNFSNATVTINDENGMAISVSDIKYDYLGYGIPNCIYWKANGLINNVKYYVQINNVVVLGKTRNYSYWFRIGDPLAPPSSLQPPTLISPDNNSTVDIPVTLQWTPVPTADSYRLQVAKSFDFQNIMLDISNLTSTSYTITHLESDTKFYWRVLATKNNSTSPWSQIYNFTTKSTTSISPLALEPANNQTDVPLRPRFVWNQVTNADYYHIQVALDGEFVYTTIDNDMILDTFFLTSNDLQPNRQYFWHIRARVGSQWGNWSSTNTFWTLNPSAIENDNNLVFFENYSLIGSNFKFSIKLPYEIVVEDVSLFDTFGRRVFLENVLIDGGSIIFETEHLPVGVYYLRIFSNRKILLFKVLVV